MHLLRQLAPDGRKGPNNSIKLVQTSTPRTESSFFLKKCQVREFSPSKWISSHRGIESNGQTDGIAKLRAKDERSLWTQTMELAAFLSSNHSAFPKFQQDFYFLFLVLEIPLAVAPFSLWSCVCVSCFFSERNIN